MKSESGALRLCLWAGIAAALVLCGVLAVTGCQNSAPAPEPTPAPPVSTSTAPPPAPAPAPSYDYALGYVASGQFTTACYKASDVDPNTHIAKPGAEPVDGGLCGGIKPLSVKPKQ
jgi:hypothetical protein